MQHLKILEAEAIDLIRDVCFSNDFEKIVVFYSIGKDSSCLLHWIKLWRHIRCESRVKTKKHAAFLASSSTFQNGNPLQCSCLENPRAGGAWWAAVYGVAQSWTRLK